MQELQQEPRNATALADAVEALDTMGTPVLSDDDPQRFAALEGLYEVSHVQTVKAGENPVGGKWTRPSGLLRKFWPTQRRSFQHILPRGNRINVTTATGSLLPTVAQAVNVISLEALWGKWRATVLLRGDVVALNATERTTDTYRPLSNRAVRALFDPPRIIFGKTGRWVNVNIGPQTSVLIDTPYLDQQVRLGLGGRSGSRFVFTKCPDDDAEANEFRALLQQPPMAKAKVLTVLASVVATSLYATLRRKSLAFRLVTVSVAASTSVMAALIAFSGGGIESNDRSIADAKKFYGTQVNGMDKDDDKKVHQ